MGGIGGRRRSLGHDGGFTLVEVMVVVLILGILLAIGVPTLLASLDRSRAASAKTRATEGLKVQKTLYADGRGYSANPLDLEAAEPSLDFRTFAEDGGSATKVLGTVYIRDVTENSATVVARSDSGDCFWTRDVNGHTKYARGGCTSPPVDDEFLTRWP